MAQQAVDIARRDVLTGLGAGIQLLQHDTSRVAGRLWSGDGDDVAVRLRLDAETLLEQGQMAVKLAQQARQMAIVLEGHDDACLVGTLLSKACYRRPANAIQVGSSSRLNRKTGIDLAQGP